MRSQDPQLLLLLRNLPSDPVGERGQRLALAFVIGFQSSHDGCWSRLATMTRLIYHAISVSGNATVDRNRGQAYPVGHAGAILA